MVFGRQRLICIMRAQHNNQIATLQHNIPGVRSPRINAIFSETNQLQFRLSSYDVPIYIGFNSIGALLSGRNPWQKA